MAVAAHVSRVAKDYTPFGYSIMESASAETTTVASGGGNESAAALASLDDAPGWLESVYIMAPGGYDSSGDDGANNWEVSVAAIDADGNPTNLASWSSWDGAAGVDLAPLVRQKMAIELNEIPAGSLVLYLASENGTPNEDLAIGVFVRFRRKA